ncbi:hypothetical protein BCU89_23895 [Vibrio splendidus]|nr:hypothetical protein BCU89_23895 [Vibrio splendidus]
MIVFMWKHFEFQASIARVYAKSVRTKVLNTLRFHAHSVRIMYVMLNCKIERPITKANKFNNSGSLLND